MLFNDGGGQSMRQETVGVTENLLKSATEEFLEKGIYESKSKKYICQKRS